MTSRVVRKSLRHAALDAQGLLSTVLLAECVSPSEIIWLISPWISDVVVFDNRGGGFSTILPDAGEREIRLAEVLEHLGGMGSTIVIATRDDPLNARFRQAIQSAIRAELVTEIVTDDLHEKALVGEDYVMTGSMNFTYSGINLNEEQLTYSRDPETVAQARAEHRAKWGPT
jgi:phosphatidylserine/phosphatidylglycerophosphate/cardiolipin synthase-like enzyme